VTQLLNSGANFLGQPLTFKGPRAVEKTSLTLLTSDGPLEITFRPMLSPEQYATLAKFITATELRKRKDFCDYFRQLAAQWGVACEAG
jgi:hypothetical protein